MLIDLSHGLRLNRAAMFPKLYECLAFVLISNNLFNVAEAMDRVDDLKRGNFTKN